MAKHANPDKPKLEDPWPASKKITKRMIKHNFLLAENREYHQVYQASVLQFRFESAWG
jgi:hypothetical protein